METVFVVLAAVLAVAVVVLLVVLVRRRSAPDAAAGEASATDAAIEPVRVRDPSVPGRELLVEFVPPTLSELAGRADFSRDAGGRHDARNAFDGLVGSVPKAAALLEAGQTMRVVGPPEAIAGLADETLELVTSNGKILGMTRDVSSGQLANHLRFAQVQISPAMAAMAAFQVMSVITGQYYLHRIDSKLATIQTGIDGIEKTLSAQTRGQLESAASFNNDVRETLVDGRMPSEDQRHGLRVARDNAQQAYVRAQAGVVDFVDTMRSFKLEDTSRAELKDHLTAAERMLDRDGPMLLFAAYVLHENRLLRLAVESDPTDAEALRSRTVSQRENMAKDLRALDKAIRKIALLRESELDERYVWFRSNDGEWARIKPMKRSYKKLKPFLERGSNLMPEPPPPSPPFIAEIRRAPSGELEMASAVLTAPANPS